MDLFTKISIEVVKESDNKKNHYQFIMPYGCKLGEAHDVCHELLQKLVEMAQNVVDKTKRKEEEAEVVSE